MNTQNIQQLLSEYDSNEVKNYVDYLRHLETEKDRKTNKLKNPWMKHRQDDYFVKCFILVKNDDLVFDGKHITLQSTGISYDYVAYKNKMLLVYPESLIDIQLVREGDKFSFSKESGHVHYRHDIPNPFGDFEIIGVYCVIKNKRGEFLNTLSRSEIDKHRKVAKTDYIWAGWFDEMCLKTVIKKACKTHFADVYSNMDALDNEQYDLDQPLGITIETKQAIEAITALEDLADYYRANKDINAGVLEDFTKACAVRKQEILASQKEVPETITEGQEQQIEPES